MDVIEEAVGIVAGAAHGEREDERDKEDTDCIVPVEEFEAVILDTLEGVGPGPPTDGAGDHHQKSNLQSTRCEHGPPKRCCRAKAGLRLRLNRKYDGIGTEASVRVGLVSR